MASPLIDFYAFTKCMILVHQSSKITSKKIHRVSSFQNVKEGYGKNDMEATRIFYSTNIEYTLF